LLFKYHSDIIANHLGQWNQMMTQFEQKELTLLHDYLALLHKLMNDFNV